MLKVIEEIKQGSKNITAKLDGLKTRKQRTRRKKYGFKVD
jgi:hypothetical protein